ncbi:putative gustatory receptor 2a [Folsomia candida]|uniref:Putative gustatory receptor 2a n=1 Tax=Folsomia candida TaxID=158441 RepID=A0A226EBI5_FOLCA|nr:putative gustatory receptor 2a [Folsomia candida]
MLSQPGVKFPFVFVYCAPVGLGYFHSIFSFVLVYTLNWFLELLLQIKVMVEWEREQILGAEFLSGVENFEIQSIMNFYAFLHQQVKCFNKLFGIWVTIDMIHSIARIIFSSYFLATQTNYATLNGISGTNYWGKLYRKSDPLRVQTNFFNVNLQLLTPVVGTITTYLIVLIQFQGSG